MIITLPKKAQELIQPKGNKNAEQFVSVLIGIYSKAPMAQNKVVHLGLNGRIRTDKRFVFCYS